MSLRDQAVVPEDRATANIFLYGPPKSGKSIGAGSAPGTPEKPILYLNADLPSATRLVHKMYGTVGSTDNPGKIMEIPLTSLATLKDVGNEMKDNAASWGTVVLDTLGDAHRKMMEDESGYAIRPSINIYGDVAVHLERFCRFMCEQPVNFVVVAHETAQRDEETGSFERLPYTGTSNPTLGSKVMAMVDVIGYTAVLPNEDKDAGPRYVAGLVNGNGHRGGDRFNVLGTYRDLDLSEWLGVIERVGEPAPKADGKKKAGGK